MWKEPAFWYGMGIGDGEVEIKFYYQFQGIFWVEVENAVGCISIASQHGVCSFFQIGSSVGLSFSTNKRALQRNVPAFLLFSAFPIRFVWLLPPAKLQSKNVMGIDPNGNVRKARKREIQRMKHTSHTSVHFTESKRNEHIKHVFSCVNYIQIFVKWGRKAI